jgi:hypothetical protein
MTQGSTPCSKRFNASGRLLRGQCDNRLVPRHGSCEGHARAPGGAENALRPRWLGQIRRPPAGPPQSTNAQRVEVMFARHIPPHLGSNRGSTRT